ncbi:AMP-binding protein [Streptomyces sp.]|uniref:AMP-binding protein n=1 Tax=Streptomyces sp. TaxID=1931 RepID=UPI002F3F03BF
MGIGLHFPQARDASGDEWANIAAEVLAVDSTAVDAAAGTHGFVALGGTSIRAIEFAARLATELGIGVEVSRLLADVPLADVLAAAEPLTPAAPAPTAPTAPTAGGPVLAGQHGMLTTELLHGGRAFHLVFSARVRGALDLQRLTASLDAVTARHEALRTVFERTATGLRRHVLARHRAVVVRQRGFQLDPADPVDALHRHLTATTGHLLDPFALPPVAFVLTTLADDDHVLTLAAHHAVLDGWSIGVLFREIFRCYQGVSLPDPPSAELLAAAEEASVRAGRAEELVRTLDFDGEQVRFPVDGGVEPAEDGQGAVYTFALDEPTRLACVRLAAELAITRNAVLLGAWSFVLARHTGRDSLLMGVPVAGRTSATKDLVGLATKLVPARVTAGETPAAHLRAASRALHAALAYDDVPLERVASLVEGAAGRRNSVVQVGFAAQDDLLPDAFDLDGLRVELHEGHTGGSTFDVTLVVRGWGGPGELAIEYATAKLAAAAAAALAESLAAAIAQFAACPDRPLREIDALTPEQRAELVAAGAARPVTWERGLWAGIEARARQQPDAIAVRAGEDVLTYAELVDAAARTSAALADAGVRAGDRVVLDVPRSAWEITAVLGVVRLGAAYAALGDAPRAAAERMLRTLEPAAVITLGTEERWYDLLPGRPSLDARAAARSAAPAVPAAEERDRPVYTSFTSGSTGTPKGVRVGEHAVLRLVHGADYAEAAAARVFARIAPLAFDASTFEIFHPLTHGGRVEVLDPGMPAPAGIADFLTTREVSGAFLTTTLFRLVVDHAPGAFTGLALVITGGEVTPAEHVRAALRAAPGLRVVHAYGPTENTTFTTVEPYDEAAAVPPRMPIGRPVAGTGVVLLDAEGRLSPRGAVGELHTYGTGLALDYAGDQEATAAAFGRFCAHLPHRLYRTGDLGRWDTRGRLEFVGRQDRQVKVRGHRVELDGVRQCIAAHPDVADVSVYTDADGTDLRVGAALILRVGGAEADVRAHAARELPAFAVPVLWSVVDQFPFTTNGKLDVAALSPAATLVPAPALAPPPAVSTWDMGELEDLVARAWADALGADDFGYDDPFFDIGGDSLLMATVRDHLRRELPDLKVTVLQLFSYPTVAELAAFLHEKIDAR